MQEEEHLGLYARVLFEKPLKNSKGTSAFDPSHCNDGKHGCTLLCMDSVIVGSRRKGSTWVFMQGCS